VLQKFEDYSAIMFWTSKDGNGVWECDDQSSVFKGALAFMFQIKSRPHYFMP